MKRMLSRILRSNKTDELGSSLPAELETSGSASSSEARPQRAVIPQNSLTSALLSVNEVMFVVDGEGRFTAATRPCVTLLGLSDQQILGSYFQEYFEDESGAFARGGKGAVRFRSKTGRLLTAQLQASMVPASKNRVFRVGLLSNVQDAGVEPSSLAAKENQNQPDRGVVAFNKAIQSKLQNTKLPYRVLAGRIEIVGLDEVKAALGERWQAHADRVRAIARQIIEKRLAPQDVYTEAQNDTFVICFSSLTTEEARLKSELIAREIREKLIGETGHVYRVVVPHPVFWTQVSARRPLWW